jgi:hypothetical protein
MVNLISAGCGIPSPWIVHTPSVSNGIVFICKVGQLEQMRGVWPSVYVLRQNHSASRSLLSTMRAPKCARILSSAYAAPISATQIAQPLLCAVFQKVHQSRGGGVYWLIAAEKDSSHANVTVEVDRWSKGECCVCMALCGISGCRCKVSWWSCTDKIYGTNNEYKSPDEAWSPSLVIWHKVTGTISL